jgi:hypothetical protein
LCAPGALGTTCVACGGANERCCREAPVCRGALTCRDTFCREG